MFFSWLKFNEKSFYFRSQISLKILTIVHKVTIIHMIRIFIFVGHFGAVDHIANIVLRKLILGYFCVTTPDSPIGHCCPKVCPLGSSVDNSYTCIPGASSHSSLHSNFSFIKPCPSETHFCHYLSGDTFSQAVCCKRPCNAMAPEALYLHGECMARGQLGAECQKHEQCGAAEGMECQMGLCRCAMGFNPAMDSLTNPVKNPSQQCVKGCDSVRF